MLLRGGYIRQLAAGIYSYLPLGRRVLRNIETIVREEMERAGAQELLLPALQPAELWRESGRYEVYGKELIKLQDRHERDFVLGPTHEETITALLGGEIKSYKKLPLILYQIQTKFRDERRPRSGLLRGREFLMKDAYSFDASHEGLDKSYRRMYEAYCRIFERCELDFRAVHADAGAIGGEGGSHEFMALSAIGEDILAVCPACAYAANLEKAAAAVPPKTLADGAVPPPVAFSTPGSRTIPQLVSEHGLRAEEIIKTLVYEADGQYVGVLVRGDHEVNEIKVKNALGAVNIALALPEAVLEQAGMENGFVGPVGLKLRILTDAAVAALAEGVTGAGRKDYHLRHVVPGRDFALEQVGDFRNIEAGEICPECGAGHIRFERGIEIGHVFKLGSKYSTKLGALFLDAAGVNTPMIMGCYGIGVSRLLAAVAEQRLNGDGVVWPLELAPYHVHLLPVSVKDGQQSAVAEQLYTELTSLGFDVLLDDRDERAGVKFKDAALIGCPAMIVVGKDASEGKVEYTDRTTGIREVLETSEVIGRMAASMSRNH